MNISASRDDSGIYFYSNTTHSSDTQAGVGSVTAIYDTISDLQGNVIASQRANGDSIVADYSGIPSSQAYRESPLVMPDFLKFDLVDDEIVPDYVVRTPPYSILLFEIIRVY